MLHELVVRPDASWCHTAIHRRSVVWPCQVRRYQTEKRRPYFASFRDTATPSTSVAGRNPPDWWDQSDA
jgi:hypothetical protein